MNLLRSTLFNVWFYGLTVVMLLAGFVVRWRAPLVVLAYSQTWARLVLAGLRVLCGIRVVVSGREYLPTAGPALIASQHQSAFDALVWLVLLPTPTYVLKRELLHLPLFGSLACRAGMIAVDRAAAASALRGLLRETDRVVTDGRQMVIFPEGTRAAAGTVRPLHPGVAAVAARTGLPVIPVTTDSGRCWSRRAFIKHPGVIQIDVHPPLPPGLSRTVLLERLEVLYRAGVGASNPVEKSVGDAGGGLSAGASVAGQQIGK
jgi:1-acyl-sn-glycerol-3-phosphate acyltransferase